MSGNLNSPLFGPQLPMQMVESVQTYEPPVMPEYSTVYNNSGKIRNESLTIQSNSIGLKYDSEKLRMDLLDPDFLEDVAKVLTYGAKKYNAHNWRGGLNYSRIIGAIYRHLTAINRGEDIDLESGLSHSSHLGANVQFLNWMMKYRPDLDDRWKP